MIKFSKSKTWLKRGREELDYYQSEQTYTAVENPTKMSHFYNVSEASYVYILDAKNGQFGEF